MTPAKYVNFALDMKEAKASRGTGGKEKNLGEEVIRRNEREREYHLLIRETRL